MRRLSLISLVATFLLFGASHVVQAVDHTQALYREALMKETGERDPEAAIPLYQQVIEEAGTDHRLVSEARLRLGGCYERIGKPKEAEQIYLQIIKESAESLAEAVRAAQANLGRLQSQDQKMIAAKPIVLVHEFHETRAAIAVGPSLIQSGDKSQFDVALDLRYRLSTTSLPLTLWAEAGALPPLETSHIQDKSRAFNSQNDDASLDFKYQIHLALIAELPHGFERTVIPEIGVGGALTASQIKITSASGETFNEQSWSPYLTAGLHFFSGHILSLRLQGTYVDNPYTSSVEIVSPPHAQSFNFSTSMWTLGAMIQVKIGWSKFELRSKE